MQSKLRQHNKRLRRAEGLLFASPIVANGLALPFAVMGSMDTRAAVGLSLTMLSLNLVAVVLAWCLKRAGYGQQLCIIAGAGVSALVILAMAQLVPSIHPQIFELMGIYFPLLAVNTLTFYIVTHCEEKKSLLHNLLWSLRNTLGFALILLPIAMFRELFGKGAVYGVKMGLRIQVPSVLLPFFGFILVGLVSAACRYINRIWKSRLLREDRRLAQLAAEEEAAV